MPVVVSEFTDTACLYPFSPLRTSVFKQFKAIPFLQNLFQCIIFSMI